MNSSQIGILIIGDEILSRAVPEINAAYMIDGLRSIGYLAGEIRIVGDNVEAIEEACEGMSGKWEYLFTSGGVGPTHDDVTFEGVARGLHLPMVKHQEMLTFLYNNHLPASHSAVTRMGILPKGAEVLFLPDTFPLIKVSNCFILPGLPHALQSKIDALLDILPKKMAPVSLLIHTNLAEIDLAESLNAIQKSDHVVAIGSYPATQSSSWNTQIRLTARDEHALSNTAEQIQQSIATLGGRYW